jgi:hypothetical protein
MWNPAQREQDSNLAWKTAGFRYRSTCRLGPNPEGSTKKAGSGFHRTTTSLSFMVRPARFERATYGFEVRTSGFPTLLKLLQVTEIVNLNFPATISIFAFGLVSKTSVIDSAIHSSRLIFLPNMDDTGIL